MSKIVKLVSATVLSTATVMFVYSGNQYYYNKSVYHNVDNKVVSIIDRTVESGFETFSKSKSSAMLEQERLPQGEYHLRSDKTEIMKDIWNNSIRSGIEWLYSVV